MRTTNTAESEVRPPVPERGRLKALSYGLGVTAVSALLGYLCGRVRGEGNEMLLTVCFGAAGAFVGLLGYGPVVGIFVGLARLFGCCGGTSGKEKSGFGPSLDKGQEEWR